MRMPEPVATRSGRGTLSRRDAGVAVLVQGLGPLSYLLLVSWVAWWHGPALQGEMAHLKAWLDLVIAFGALGLPQALTYAIGRLSASPARLAGLSVRLALLASLPLAAIGAWAWVTGSEAVPVSTVSSAVALTLAGVAGILGAQWRGVLLALHDGVAYSLSVAWQPLTLLVLILLVPLAGIMPLPWLLVGSFGSTALWLGLCLRRFLPHGGRPSAGAVPFAGLLRQGVQAFVHNVAVALLPLATIWLLQSHGADLATIGRWSVAALLFQALATPLAMLAPLVFARWSAAPVGEARQAARTLAGTLFRLTLLPTLALALSAWLLLPAWLDQSYAGVAPAIAVLALSLPCLTWARTLAPAVFATGESGRLSIMLIVRLVVALGTGFVLLRLDAIFATPYVPLAIGWTLGEVAFAVLARAWLRRADAPMSTAAGQR